MNLSNLKPSKGSTSNRKRIGRGNATGQGRTAGKGHNGYKSRSGANARLHFEGGQTPLARRLPKRGMGTSKFNHLSSPKKKTKIINISDLNILKVKDIDKNLLLEKGIISNINVVVKVLSAGELNSALNVKVNYFSSAAKKKIEDAGGSVELV